MASDPLQGRLTQRICTECGVPFVAQRSNAKTCGASHRKSRSLRKQREGAKFTEFKVAAGEVQVAMEKASVVALDTLPRAAHEALREEMRPHVREHLTGEVLQAIGEMTSRLLPLAIHALEEDLAAVLPMLDRDGFPMLDTEGQPIWIPDGDRRGKATALALKYTVGQPGLSPQPEAPEQAPITVIFPALPAPTQVHTDADSTAEPLQLAEGERLCDMCGDAKPAAEFVGSSDRCSACHGANRARIEAAIAERTQTAS